MATGRELHIDAPLTNIAVKAFAGRDDFIADEVFPVTRVDKQTNGYYVLTPASWLRIPNTRRAPKTKARRIEFDVSTDAYACKNYALSADIALEDLTNADQGVALRENTVNLVLEGLAREKEDRLVQRIIASGSVGTATTLTGVNKWLNVSSAYPPGDVMSAHTWITGFTGLQANTAIMDADTLKLLRINERMLSFTKYADGGLVSDERIREFFNVDRLLIGRGMKNTAKEGEAPVYKSIWQNSGAGLCILARIEPAVSLDTATWGLSFRWQPAGFPAPLTVGRQQFGGPGTEQIEVVEAQYFQDERVIAPTLTYAIWATNL